MTSASTRAVYLDYAASTPVDPRVAAAMAECLTADGLFANPSSNHPPGEAARRRIEQARAQVAALINAPPSSVVWTSCATESNNLAILGFARHHCRRNPPAHIVTSRIEHKAVIAPCRQLEREGWRITWLKPDANGLIQPEHLAAALTSETRLVSLMHVNNETGVITDIAAMGSLCRERGILFHVDAAQSAGKIPIDVEAAHIDLLSLSAHKLYGPKGIGALYVRPQPPIGLEPLIFGGGHEGGLRSGTLATHQIVGMGLACELATREQTTDHERLLPLKQALWRGLQPLGGIHLNGAFEHTVPHILNISIEGVDGESLRAGLEPLAVSSSSTCNSATGEPSYVLRALGRPDRLIEASLRLSLGRTTTPEDITHAIDFITQAVRRLRTLSPATGLPPDAHTCRIGESGSESQGAWVRFLAQTNDAHQITTLRYQVYGNPHVLAACEWLAQNLPGRPLDDLLPEGVEGLAMQINAPPEQLGRLFVVEDALRKLAN